MMADDDAEDFMYDVFLSFRGGTRYIFTGHLYAALIRHGINTFRDDEKLRIGDEIRPALLHAIHNSRMAIVVLCQDYASSTWCLDELLNIMHSHDNEGKQVSAIFYKVEPANVRHQRHSYEAAMIKHEARFGRDSQKIKAWRSALTRVCDLSGEHCKENMYESELIEKIVKDTLAKLPPVPLLVKQLVGLETRFEVVKSLLDIGNDTTVCMLGVYGAGGIGKTTFAMDLYNKIRHHFQAASFLGDIRERSTKSTDGPLVLQRTLLSEMGEGAGTMMGSTSKGASEIKRRLGHKRVLLVLDDVDTVKQLESLAGGLDWFGSGSRIIITTRDESVLDKHVAGIKKFKMEELNYHDSLQLFCLHAFNMSGPAESFDDISKRAVGYAKGLPLALKVIGSNLKGWSIAECEMELEKYRKIPDAEIQGVLEISYNSLSEFDKKIFLDIACFFKGERWDYVKRILVACGFCPVIRLFVNKSLITVDENGCLELDMGKEIVRKESPSDLGARSRLCSPEEIIRVLEENSGSSKIEGIMLDPPQREEVCCADRVFEKMKNLRILIIRNTTFPYVHFKNLPNELRLLDWQECIIKDLFPPGSYLKRIVDLYLPKSGFTLQPFQKFQDLTFINFSDCPMTHIPDVSQAKRLRTLTLDRCKYLVEFDKSVGFMPNLAYLSASECTELKSFVPSMYLPSLEMLSFNFCSKLEHFPDVEQKMDKPLKIHMTGTAIQNLPDSIGNLSGLEYIDMSLCKELRDLPRNFFFLPKPVTLKISGCPLLGESFKRFKERHSMANGCSNLRTLYFKNANLLDEDLDVILEIFPKLEDLRVSHNNFISLPESIKGTHCLKSLDVSCCANLQEIPELSPSIQKVDAWNCWSLTSEASTALLSKVRKESNRFEVVMPKMEIPQWFDCASNEDIPLFWARHKLPVVALAFVFGEFKEMSTDVNLSHQHCSSEENWHPVTLHLFIDDREVCCKDCRYFDVGKNHVLLCDLRVLFNDEEWKGLDASLGDDWTAVQVSYESDLILSEWGVYVYKQETNMEDIIFSLPNSSNSNSNSSSSSSRPCMAPPLVWWNPMRRVRQDTVEDIYMKMPPNPIEEISMLGLILWSLMDKDKTSSIAYGTSSKQQQQDFIRQFFRAFETRPALKSHVHALLSDPEMVNMSTSAMEHLRRSVRKYEASPYLMVVQRDIEWRRSWKDWINMLDTIDSYVELDNGKRLRIRQQQQREALAFAEMSEKAELQDMVERWRIY
ncbi:hypothetical protein RIF29_13603 [Crotalaria pallida]|uniref:TIR domain-containing protein n=1 Tax=Crotalaria pallida TaxID=3830 RepID=A0AAN9IPH3_CROPI